MKKFAKLLKNKRTDKVISEPIKNPEDSSFEHRLTPTTISGIVVPWEKTINNDKSFVEYKLACDNGDEYLILSNSEVADILPLYCWKEVQIVGLLNKSHMILIPQKVFPKGPNGESSNVIDLSVWRNQNVKRKVLNKINELVIIPAAVLAVLAS